MIAELDLPDRDLRPLQDLARRMRPLLQVQRPAVPRQIPV